MKIEGEVRAGRKSRVVSAELRSNQYVVAEVKTLRGGVLVRVTNLDGDRYYFEVCQTSGSRGDRPERLLAAWIHEDYGQDSLSLSLDSLVEVARRKS